MSELMPWFRFVIAALAVWRVTHLITREDGPGQCLVWLRRRLGAGFWGQLMDCFYCLSLWVAAPAALWMSQSWMERVFFWLALSAAAILVDRVHLEPVVVQRLKKEEL